MKIKPIILITIVFSLFCSLLVNSQDSKVFADNYYIHSDRDMYVAGENIQFKIYPNSKIASKYELSKFIYVSLANAQGEVISKAKLKTNNNSAFGYIKIPENIKSQYLWMYVYSKWQRNFGIANFYKKKIFAINSKTGVNYSSKELNRKEYNLLMFPEFGELIRGIENKVVFYCIDKYNRIVKVAGEVVDENGNVITQLITSDNKIGSFKINPAFGLKYKASIKVGGSNLEFDLPKIKKQPFIYSINNSDRDNVLIARNSVLKSGDIDDISISVFHNGIEYLNFKDSNLSSPFKLQLQKEQMISGLNEIIFRDNKNEVLFTRSLIVKSNEVMNIQLMADKKQYTTRELVTVNLNTYLHNMPQNNANLSVSVSRIDSTIDYNNYSSFDSIQTNMFLNNEFVEMFEPEKIDESFEDDFEHYLITKSRTSSLDSFDIKFIPEMNNSYLQGRIFHADSSRNIGKSRIVMTALDSINSTNVVVTNISGEFHFVLDEGLSTENILVQSMGLTKDVIIKTEDNFENEFEAEKIEKPIFNKEKIESLKHLILNYQIMKQYETSKSEEKIKISENSKSFYGVPDSSYLLSKFISLPTTEEVFHNLIMNVTVRKKKNKYSFAVFDKKMDMLKFSPLVLIDGIPISDYNILLKVPPAKIKKIEVITRYYLIGETLFGGVISVFSKDNDYAGIKLAKSAKMISFQQVQVPDSFIESGNVNSKKKNIPDLRNTIYWNPKLLTDVNGKEQFQFYTSDEIGKFLIKVEGISRNGVPGKGYFVYEVKSKTK